MDKVLVASVQQRMSVLATQEEFEAQLRRFMRLAQSKAAQLVVLPELSGLMLAPPLFSGVKRGFMRQVSQGRQPGAGPLQRGVKRMAEAATDVLGGYRGSLVGLLRKRGDELWEVYTATLGRLAREFGLVVVGGSLFVRDLETGSVRHRACVFDVDGTVIGCQDKLNLTADEQELVEPGTEICAIDTRAGRLGVLLGWDILYPELPRALAAQGAEVLIGLGATPGAAQGQMLRSALSMRVEENQVFGVGSFMIGSNYLGQLNREEYLGQSAVLAPISLTDRGSGVLVQMGTNRTEGLIAAALDYTALHALWQNSNFRPRQQMVLANAGSVLAEVYDQGLTLDQSAARHAPVPSETLEPEPAPPVGFSVPVVPPPAVEPVIELPPAPTPEPAAEEPPALEPFEKIDVPPHDESQQV